MKDPLVRHVERLIETEALLTPGASVVVGVSGGLDSVALLHILHTIAPKWRLQLIVAHVNYRLRGAASDRDAAFVRQLAGRLQWPCRVKRCRFGAGKGQEWARSVRYQYFTQLAAREGGTIIAVAHHRDDQCETVLLHLLRGTGPAGLCGMPYQRCLPPSAQLIRPLLHTPREALIQYARRHQLQYRQDTSNATMKYLRNRLRLQLFPLLRRLNPQAEAHIAALALLMQEETGALEALAGVAWEACHRRQRRKIVLDRVQLHLLPTAIRRRVLRRAFAELRGSLRSLGQDHLVHMDAIIQGKGSQYALPGPTLFKRQGDLILFAH